MCYKPLTITNPALVGIDDKSGFSNFIDGFSKRAFSVGCGFCPQCQNVRQREWQLRLRYEWKACKLVGGFCFKEELTYSDSCVPSYNGVMCFSKSDVQKFLKRLRRRLDTYCKKYSIETIKLTYFCVCEYGGNFTHRPHYHILLFVYSSSIPVKLFDLFVSKSWTLGLTNHNTGRNKKRFWSVSSKVVDSFAGIEYVTKYLFKDKVFIKNLICQSNGKFIVDFLREKLNFDVANFLDSTDVDDYSSFYLVWKFLNKSPFKFLLPFSLKSQGIGKSLLDELSYDDFIRGTFNDYTVSQVKKIPRYYFRKVFYDYVSFSRTYIPKKSMLDLNYNKFVDSYLHDNFDRMVLSDVPHDVVEEIKFQLNLLGVDIYSNEAWRYWCVYNFMLPISGKRYVNPCFYSFPEEFLSCVESVYQRGYIYSVYNRMTFNVNTVCSSLDELKRVDFDVDFVDQSTLEIIDRYTSDTPYFSLSLDFETVFRRIELLLQTYRNKSNRIKCEDMLLRIKINNLSINKKTKL